MIVSTLSTESTTSEAAPLFKAELTEVLNGIHTLVFETSADSELTSEIKEEYTVIFKDEQGHKEFLIKEVVDNDSDYLPIKTVSCQFSPVELKDELLLNNYTYDNASLLLNYMLKGTRWQLGTVDSAIYNRNFNEETENESVWTGINAVAKVFEADLYFHVSVSEKKVVQRYVSLYKQLGSNSGKRFEIDKDITEIKRTVDTTDIKTAIYPLGKETEDENGNKRRIDISSVSWSVSKGDPVDKPAGQMFISDNEAKLQWGRRNLDGTIRDRFIFMEMDFDSPEALASMAWVQLGRYRKPKVTYEAKVIDLYRLTQDEELKHEKVFLGDTVSVIDRNFSNTIEITERVVQLKTDLLLPENTSVVIGNSKSSYSSDINRVDDIAKQLSSVESSVNSVITSANGKNKTYYGTVEPVHSELAIGDSWVRPHPENPTEKQWLTWNGTNWDIVLDTSETSQIRNDIEELDQISKETQEKADQAIEDAGFSKIEIGKINKELIEITADTDVALEEARQAKQQAFNSEQLANSAKQDAILAIQKGDQNSTQITTLEGQQKLTNTKVEGNTANILSLQTDSEKLSLSIGKVQTDVENINVGDGNDFPKSEGERSSVPTGREFINVVDWDMAPLIDSYGIDREYTLSVDIKAPIPGKVKVYSQNGSSTRYSIGYHDVDVTTEYQRFYFVFKPTKSNMTDPRATLAFYGTYGTGVFPIVRKAMFTIGNVRKEWQVSARDLTTKSEFSTFEATMKGFQTTVNSDITGLKSQQTQMAGQITSTVEKVDNLEFNNRNLVIGTPNPDIWFSSPQSSTSSDYTSDTKWVYPNDWGIGDFFRGFNFTTKTDITVSSKIKIEKVNGQPLKVADFPEDFVFSVFRITGTGTSWRDFAKIRRGQLKDGVSDYFVSETFKLTQGDIDTNYQNKFIRKWMRKFPDGYKVTLTEYILSSSTKRVLYQPAPEDNASKSEVIQLSDQITQTVNKVETVDGKVTSQQSQITQLDNRITSVAKETTELETKVTSIEQTTKGIQSSVVEIENSQIKQQSQITQLSNNINLKVDKDNSIAQINLSPETIRLDAKFIHLSGTSKIDNAVIKTAHIADLSVTGAKIQDASIANAKILNLDVDKITGNTTSFVKSSWNGISTSVNIDSEGLITSDLENASSVKFYHRGMLMQHGATNNGWLNSDLWSDNPGVSLAAASGKRLSLMTNGSLGAHGEYTGNVFLQSKDDKVTIGGGVGTATNWRGPDIEIKNIVNLRSRNDTNMELLGYKDVKLSSMQKLDLYSSDTMKIHSTDFINFVTGRSGINLEFYAPQNNVMQIRAVKNGKVISNIAFWEDGDIYASKGTTSLGNKLTIK